MIRVALSAALLAVLVLGAPEKRMADCGRQDAPECSRWKSKLREGWCASDRYSSHCAHTCGLCKVEEIEAVLANQVEVVKRDCFKQDAPECSRWASKLGEGWCASDRYSSHCAHTC